MKNKIKESFDQVHAERNLIEKTKQNVWAEVSRRERRKSSVFAPKLAGVIITLFVVVSCYFGYSYLNTETVISFDINPSVELNVNKYDRIIGVHAFNEDGKELIQDVDLKHLNYIDGINQMIASEPVDSRLKDNQLLEITVVCDSKEQNKKYEEAIEHHTNIQEEQIFHMEHHQHVEEAHQHGFSCGKYRAYLDLKAKDDSITEEQAKHMTIREMHDHTHHCKNQEDVPSQSHQSHHHRHGHGHK